MEQTDRQQPGFALELVYTFYVRNRGELHTMEEVKLTRILAAMIRARIGQLLTRARRPLPEKEARR